MDYQAIAEKIKQADAVLIPDNPHRSSCPDHQKLQAGGRCHHGEEGC